MKPGMIIGYFQRLRHSHRSTPIPRVIWRDPISFIACGFGIGAIPFMPGTWATLFSLLCYGLMFHWPLWIYSIFVVVLNASGVWLCGYTNRVFGTDDHPAAVWDEIAAFLIAVWGLPFTLKYMLTAFILFRFLDIVKPWPIGWLDKNIHGGWGVMLDDIVAAVVTALIIFLLRVYWGY